MRTFLFVTSLIALFILGVGGIMYPIWLHNGVLDNWYVILTLPIAVYGGFIANLIWLIKNVTK